MRIALLGFFGTLALLAQDPRGFINGQVTDTTGGVIPNATVALTHTRTGVTMRVTTNGEGLFDANYLPTGEYTMQVEFTGFKTWSRSNVDLRIGERVRIDVTLEPGAASEKIQVTAESPVLETTNATVGQVVDRKVLENIDRKSVV